LLKYLAPLPELLVLQKVKVPKFLTVKSRQNKAVELPFLPGLILKNNDKKAWLLQAGININI